MKQEMENGNVEGQCKGNGRIVGRRIVKQFSRNPGEEKNDVQTRGSGYGGVMCLRDGWKVGSIGLGY